MYKCCGCIFLHHLSSSTYQFALKRFGKVSDNFISRKLPLQQNEEDRNETKEKS